MLAASCQDTELAETLETTNAQVMFSLAMDSPSARSRSTWDDYKPTGLGNGTYYDNKIDYDQFIVKIEANGTTYNVIDIVKSKKGKPEEGKYNEYNFVGTVQTLDGKNVGNLELKNAKISVYVNMGKKNISETFLQGAEYMPMFGFHTANLKFAPGKREEVKTPIYLLRAMAKIEVALTEELAEKYDLKGVTLNQYNGTGYCLPNSDAISSAQNTLGMSTDGVFNENIDSKTSLAFVPVEETSSYVVYLPEIAKNENLKVQVELLPEGAPEGTTSEEGSFALMQYEVNKDPKAIDIVRNHWYKYTISGFAESEIQVQYNTLDWQPEKIEIGGEGFLFLNKDVIEIYNSNIDADQLKFSSSSPIKSIVLTDLYKHTNNGNFVEGATDGFSAYYISKFGQKIQLGTPPGFDLEDVDVALENENTILNLYLKEQKNFDKDVLNGDITIISPFIDYKENENNFVDSHYNTPRYLEYLVTNEQNQTATFRVIQYPPMVIINEEGFYSYRDDFCVGNRENNDKQPAIHFENYQPEAYIMASYHNGDIHQVDPNRTDQYGHNYVAITGDIPGWKPASLNYFKEMLIIGAGSTTFYKSIVPPYGQFVRTRWGQYFPQTASNPTIVVGPEYYDPNYVHPYPDVYKGKEDLLAKVKEEGNDGWWRKHYSGNLIEFFASKVISQVYRDGINRGQYNRLPGQADIYYHFTNATYDDWRLVSKIARFNTMVLNNNRMYHIQTMQNTGEFPIGYPKMVDENTGKEDNEYGVVEFNSNNQNLVSPSFMVASQLGETETPVEDNPEVYKDPSIEFLYDVAKTHCREYVETTFEDKNGNGIPEPHLDETVTHYKNWRLPTRKEMELILNYQKNSRAMDVLITGEKYICVTGDIDEPFIFNPDYSEEGYHIRCVRDVKPKQGDNK